MKAAAKVALAAAGNNEAPDAMQMRTGTIVAIDKAVSPWTATLRGGGVDIPGITMLGWYDPVVGDTVQYVEQGPMRFILGICAPGKVYMPPSPPPPPAAPPAPPAAPLVVREVPVAAIASATGPSEKIYNSWSGGRLYQSGGSLAQRGFWFYGTGIATAKGAGTILGGKIFIQRINTSHGNGGGGNVRLGSHTYETQPGGIPGAHGNITAVGQLGRGDAKTFDLPAGIVAGMNSGAIKGLGLEPGVLGYTSVDYIIAEQFGAGTEWSGSLTLVVQG